MPGRFESADGFVEVPVECLPRHQPGCYLHRRQLADGALPAEVTGTVSAALRACGQPAEHLTGPVAAQLQAPIQHAFAAAVNTALLSCAAAALLGAVVALLLVNHNKPATAVD